MIALLASSLQGKNFSHSVLKSLASCADSPGDGEGVSLLAGGKIWGGKRVD